MILSELISELQREAKGKDVEVRFATKRGDEEVLSIYDDDKDDHIVWVDIGREGE